MNLKENLMEEEKKLITIREKIQNNLKNVPDGRLRVGKSQNCVQYYYCKEGTSDSGTYLSKKDIALAKQLAQKSYDKNVLKCVNKRLPQIERILKDYEDNEIELLYLREHPERRKLIEPVEFPFEQKLDMWAAEPYECKKFRNDFPTIVTNKGLRVRSKSEKIMADYFDSLGIIFKYECPLWLEPYGFIYPDFTFLSPKTGSEIYWEHEGMMDNPEYAKTAIQKIELYESNEIRPGENLILTFQTSLSPINMNIIKDFSQKYLL